MNPSSSCRLLVFDWDGTLMDSVGRIVNCLQGAIAALGIEHRDADRLRHVIGMGMREAVLSLYPETDEDLLHAFIQAYRERYLFSDSTPTPLFEGVPEILQTLEREGYWCAIATGKSRAGLDRVLAETGLGRHFLTTRCSDESHSKPNPHMLLSIMDELGVASHETMMIGDSILDLQMAANARAHGIGVTSGAHGRDELLAHEPRHILDDIRSLPRWLLQETT